jgi:hypothetical protein
VRSQHGLTAGKSRRNDGAARAAKSSASLSKRGLQSRGSSSRATKPVGQDSGDNRRRKVLSKREEKKRMKELKKREERQQKRLQAAFEREEKRQEKKRRKEEREEKRRRKIEAKKEEALRKAQVAASVASNAMYARPHLDCADWWGQHDLSQPLALPTTPRGCTSRLCGVNRMSFLRGVACCHRYVCVRSLCLSTHKLSARHCARSACQRTRSPLAHGRTLCLPTDVLFACPRTYSLLAHGRTLSLPTGVLFACPRTYSQLAHASDDMKTLDSFFVMGTPTDQTASS